MIVRGIDSVVVIVGDLEKARAFYGRTLGLTERSADEKSIAYGVGGGPGLVVQLRDLDPGPPHPSPRIWLRVADARAEAEALRSAGIRLIAPPWSRPTGWVVEVADPWGNILGLVDAVA